MSHIRFHTPSARHLNQATVVALLAAAAVLLTLVLPAEYGIDPTGLGGRLGLTTLHQIATQESEPAQDTDAPPAAQQPAAATVPVDLADQREAEKSAQVFGANPGQSFATSAVQRATSGMVTDRMEITLPPGKGAEIKVPLMAGDSLQFHWQASADVAVDMHGDRVDAGKDEYTSYWIEAAQREGAGALTAPFDGNHGWYWQNRSTTEITVRLEVSGFAVKLFRPGHS